MARSKRKTPVSGVTMAVSEKADKVASHRRHRKALKQALVPTLETPLPLERELTNRRSMAKEGKWRFDPREQPRRMRK
jgi:hypothetical protein